MRIAIVGAGISGLACMHRLWREHQVTLFEADARLGGHTHTVDVELDGERHAVDTGFVVFNDRTYPKFVGLLNELGVPSQPTRMSFSVRTEPTGLEYNGSSLNGLFAQRGNLFRASFHRMTRDILRFNRLRRQSPAEMDEGLTLGVFLTREGFSREFAEHYLLPMGSAIWSCPTREFACFPLRFIVEFFGNHGLLQIRDRPTWRVITGGSKTYVERMSRDWGGRVRLSTPIESVVRNPDGVQVRPRGQPPERFDHVILACHADQALRLLGARATELERDVLSAFPYSRNEAWLHTDTSLLPRRKRAWACWNYLFDARSRERATVTYNMNLLQGLASRHVFCVSLNCEPWVRPEKVLRKFTYHHPIFSTHRAAAQRRQAELASANRTSYCGAYWGNGFHEDGVRSAWAVCQALEGRASRFRPAAGLDSRSEPVHAGSTSGPATRRGEGARS